MGNTSPMEEVRMDLEYNLADGDRQYAPETASTTQTQRTIKKRTKTGCLTCRQRRIKCGEEKPICNNCVKSKRECKGYAQRLVFKNPLGLPESSGSQHVFDVQAQPVPLGPSSVGYGGPAFSQQRPSGSQPILAPMPMVSASYRLPSTNAYLANEAIQEAGSMPISYPVPRNQGQFPASNTPVTSTFPPYMQPRDGLDDRSPRYTHNLGPELVNNSGGALQLSTSTTQGISYWDPPQNELPSRHTAGENLVSHPTSANVSQYTNEDWPLSTGHPLTREQQGSHFSRPLVSSGSSTQLIHADEEEDDNCDVGTDEEPEDQTSAQNFNHMSLIVASANQDEWRLRSFTTYLNEPNVLASYQPSLGSSPLNNPKTARIFLHFIHSTGPSLSIYERRPVDPSTMLGTRVPAAQQGLWTYTLPLKALENQALLQAILALSSLHISLLQQDSPAVSLKHYHYALKRVGVAVGLPTRRKQIGTLAATLLLAYYEVMSADHYKWNSHIAGSAHLIREIDFARVTCDLRAHRRRVLMQRQSAPSQSHTYPFKQGAWEDDPFAEKEMSVDDDMVGLLLGRAINYDDFGQVDHGSSQPRQHHFTRKDIETFRIQCDLYWWYCKQDAFQSIISGGRLFMPYSLWGQCPPRAGLGRLDAIYGSADHIWLLLARLADFGYRDRKRKLTAVKSTGSEWRPDTGFFDFMVRFAGSGTASGHPPYGKGQTGPNPGRPQSDPVPPHAPDSQQSKASSSFGRPKEAPPMYGMAPSSMPRRLPPSFAESAPGENSGNQDNEDTELSYNEAEHEWEEIRAAIDTFGQALGPDFSPLPPDSAPPISTPFGLALQYRTNTIAVLWSYYYTARILLHRLHPCMPPAMMMAAGVAAPTTAEFSQIIGKIAGGIYYPQSFNLEAGHLSPTLGSCLIEATVPIFFAAVQCTDLAQRVWVATKLRDVSRLTGWKSSDAMAQGCESFWRISAKSGLGPPYDAPYCPRTPGQPEGYTSQANQNPERRFVAFDPPGSTTWAKGILSLEADLVNLEIVDQK